MVPILVRDRRVSLSRSVKVLTGVRVNLVTLISTLFPTNRFKVVLMKTIIALCIVSRAFGAD